MSFWHSELGQLSGKPEDSYAKAFKSIPNDTSAIAKIVSFCNKEYNGMPYLQIEWSITSEDFTGRRIFQKLHVFDNDPKKRHRFLNLLMLIYRLFELSPKTSEAPTDNDLKVFEGKHAGIKIQLTEPNDDGKQYNWVSEVSTIQDFVCEVGTEPVKAPVHRNHLDSAFARNKQKTLEEFEDDMIPF